MREFTSVTPSTSGEPNQLLPIFGNLGRQLVGPSSTDVTPSGEPNQLRDVSESISRQLLGSVTVVDEPNQLRDAFESISRQLLGSLRDVTPSTSGELTDAMSSTSGYPNQLELGDLLDNIGRQPVDPSLTDVTSSTPGRFTSVTPSTSGYPNQLELGDLLGNIGGQIAGLEGPSLDALQEISGGNIGKYIQEFVRDRYNFDLPNSYVDLYNQQIGSARATDASEELIIAASRDRDQTDQQRSAW